MQRNIWIELAEGLGMVEGPMNFQKLSRQKNMDRYGTTSGRADRDLSREIGRMTGAPPTPPRQSAAQQAAARAFFAKKEPTGKPGGQAAGDNPLLRPSGREPPKASGVGRATKDMAAPGAQMIGGEPTAATKAVLEPSLELWKDMSYDTGDTRKAMAQVRKELQAVQDPDERKRALGWAYRIISFDGVLE